MPSPLHPTLPVREHSGPPCPASPRDPATPRSQCLPGAWGGEGEGQHWQVQEQSRQGDLPRPQQHALSLPAGAPSAQLLLPSIQSAWQRQRSSDQTVSFFSNDLRLTLWSSSSFRVRCVPSPKEGRGVQAQTDAVRDPSKTARSVWFSCTSLCGGKFPPFKDCFLGELIKRAADCN